MTMRDANYQTILEKLRQLLSEKATESRMDPGRCR